MFETFEEKKKEKERKIERKDIYDIDKEKES